MADELKRINPSPTVYQPDQITVAAGGNPLTRDERKTVKQYRTQMAAITAQTAKTIYAEQMYGQMVEKIHDTAVQTLTYIEQAQNETKSTAVRMFCEREKKLFEYQAMEMMATGGQMLHNEVARSVYPQPKQGWWDR